MKTILLGGLEPELSRQVHEAFGSLKDHYVLLGVETLGELLVLLETARGDLLFLDLDTPGGVALDWLARLAEIKSSIPILGAGRGERPDITAYEMRFPDQYFPFLTYLRKPLTVPGIIQAVESELRHIARGVIEGLSLASLLQMLHMEGKTCTIRVNSGRRQGFFYMRAGQIINARYRRAEGEEAALLLLASASPKAEIDGQLHDSTVLIHTRLEELLMEAMRIHDENTRDHKLVEDGGECDELPASETGKWELQPQPSAPVPPPRPRKRYLLIAAAVLLPASALPFLLPREARVAVQTSPPGAVILLDSRPQGKAPLTLVLPKPLQGSLQAELAGYVSQAHQLEPGEQTVTFSLQASTPPA
ncbi:MAG TPA: DUF4388 domain-containing protein, partial [Holophaga sp.]|nr:DUF4388 domain-containing protein [Holophaga sp.]